MTLRAWFGSKPTVLLLFLVLGGLTADVVWNVRRARGQIDDILDEGVVGLDRAEQMLQTLLDLRAGVLETLIPASESDRAARAANLAAWVDSLDRQNDGLAELEQQHLMHDDEGLALKALVDATEESVRQVIVQIRPPGGDVAPSVRDAESVSAQIDACATELQALSMRVSARARVADSEIPDALWSAERAAFAFGGIALLVGLVGLVQASPRRKILPERARPAAERPCPAPGDRLRILHVLTHLDAMRGGAIQALLLARAQQRAGHDVRIVANSAEPAGPIEPTFAPWAAGGLPFEFLRMGDPQGRFCRPGEVAKLGRILAAGAFDVVHVHRDKALLFTVAASEHLEIPALISQRGTTHRFRHDSVAVAHRSPRVDRFVAVAEAVKAALVAQGVAPERVAVVYGSFDVARFDPERVDSSRVRAELRVPAGAKLVAVLGELNDRKDPKNFIRAFGAIARKRDDVRFVHAGGGDEEHRRKCAALARAQCGDKLTFLGWRDDVPEILAAADVVVNSSTKNEGLTGAIREALAMARAVVCTATDGNPEIVIDGVTGKLVPPKNSAALAAAIEPLLDDAELRARLGAAGRKLVLEKMTMEIRAARVEEIYREVLAGRFAVPRAGAFASEEA